MLQSPSLRPHLSPGDAISWHPSDSSSNTIIDNIPSYNLHALRFDGAKLNQSMAFRRASLATSPPTKALDMCETPHLTRTPWELERYKKNSVWKHIPQETQLSIHVFKNLPREVYDCVLEQLELLHLAERQHCPSCYLRDLYSLSLTSRAWDRAATLQMYRKVRVLSHDDDCRLPKLRVAGTSRLKLLRRTLRERTALAKIVRDIYIPDLQALYSFATIEREEIANLAASLVMACPNLERLVGFHTPYTHSFDRLSYALSTRANLKERLWFMADTHAVEDEEDEDSTRGYYHAACDPTEKFLQLNSNQRNLSTLVLHQESTQPAIDLNYRAVVGTMRQLPLLRHLSLSGLSKSSFSNLALNALPPDLESLRLENLPGINDRGLQRLSSTSTVASWKRLALIDLDIDHLDAVAGFLSPNLRLLEKFTLCQRRAPEGCTSPVTPAFRSNTLKTVHWEIRSQLGPEPSPLAPYPLANDEPVVCLATRLLATSIKNGLLPALRRLRVPHDPQGVLQALCKPLGTALLRSDAAFFTTTIPRHDHAIDTESTCSLKEFLSTTSGERADSVMVSPSSASFASHVKESPLATAPTPARSRLAAHGRILSARRTPDVMVRVTDAEDNVQLETNIGGFLGDVRSNITYSLTPDRNRQVDEEDGRVHEWITGIDDIMGEWAVVPTSGGCPHAVGGMLGTSAVELQDLF